MLDRSMHYAGYDIPSAGVVALTTNWRQLQERIIEANNSGATMQAMVKKFGVPPKIIERKLILPAKAWMK